MKKISIVIGILALTILVVPLALPSQFSMSRKIVIDAPLATVFTKLTDLNEYVKWNPFPEGDPTNQADVSGLGVGSSLVWKGDKTGEGKMTITDIEPDKKISVKMDFYKPLRGEGTVQWITNASSESKTELVWTFEQNLPFFSRYFGLVMDSMMGKHFEKGLLNYKNLIESAK